MSGDRDRPVRTFWLAVVLPFVAAGVGSLWLEAAVRPGCSAGGGGPGRVGLALLVGAVAVAVGAYAWHRRRSALAIAVQVVFSLALAAVVMLFALLVWGAAHGCFN